MYKRQQWGGVGSYFPVILSIAIFTQCVSSIQHSYPGQPGSSSCTGLAHLRMHSETHAVPQDSNAESAEPTSQNGTGRPRNGPETLCWLCRNVQVDAPIYSCVPCNTAYTRILYYKTRMDSGSIRVWYKVDKDRRRDFLRSVKDLSLIHI